MATLRAYDLAVVGSGPGGYAAALSGARRGLRVCLIEREQLGGVCLNIGCIPTKALLSVARFIRRLEQARQMGVTLHGYDVDYRAIRARGERIVTTLRRGLVDLLNRERVELISGTASFEHQTQLLIERDGAIERLRAERVILASGAKPLAGPWVMDERTTCSYRGLLLREDLPRSLLVIGGGVVGCEMASCFSAFGSSVTIVEQQPQLLPCEDPEAVRWLTRRFQSQGIKVFTQTTIEQLSPSSTGVAAILSSGARIDAECCLVAIGQRPNIQSLRLEAAGVSHGVGVTVDSSLCTSQSHISAIGDCLEGHGLAHLASAEGALAVRHLLGDPTSALEARDVPRCVFTEPEIAQVGLLDSQAVASRRVSRFSFGALGKSHCDDDTEGFVKLVVEPSTDRILGATIVGSHASSLIHAAVLAIHHGLSAKQLSRTITAHPTLPEALTETAAHLYGESLCVAASGSTTLF
jgi:dihydrolipoamide dehydrogenase